MWSKNQNLVEEEYPAQQGSFVSGFTIGLMAGAAGYFLFGTQRGTAIRKQLIKEWEGAKENMVKEGVIADNQISLRGVIQQFVQSAFQVSVDLSKTSLAAKARKGKPVKRRGSAKRFHGT